MKAFFIGLGSIGQRHLNNFKEITDSKSEVLVYRTTNHNLIIKDGIAKACDSLQRYYDFKQVDSIEEGLKESPEVAFITNPSAKHMDVAIELAKGGCNLFIEKPLSNSLDRLDVLQQVVISNKLIATVGYQTRFHPIYKFVQQILSEKNYGKAVSASFEWGTYLPSHHPYEDYSLGYAARKDLGGGVVLGLSPEIDLITSFWGQPQTVYALGGKFSSLDMNAEDTVSVLMGFKQRENIFPVTLFLSYAQKRETRNFKIQFEDVLLKCDLLAQTAKLFGNNSELIEDRNFSDLKRNDLFIEEIKSFLAEVENKEGANGSLQKDIETLQLALRIKGQIDV